MEDNRVLVNEIPHNISNEIAILGIIMLEEKLIKDIVDTVNYKMFYDEFHQHIFTAMLYLYHNHIAIGYETLLERLKVKLKGAKSDGDILDYLIDLNGSSPSSATFDNRIELLIETYRKRELWSTCKGILETNLQGIASANIVKKIEGVIENMGISSNIELDNFSDYIDDWVVELEKREVKQTYKMGYKLLDEMVLIEPSNLMLISARPSLGKSAFALNVAKNFCLQGAKTLFVSLEMSKREIMNRLVANKAEVEAQKLKRKQELTSNEWGAILKAKEEIKKWSLNIYDKGAMYIEQLEGLCKYLKKKNQLDVVVVDYLQLLDSHNHNKNRVQQVSYISRKLKQIAMELEVPVVALSQLSRAGVTDSGKPREPQLSDLRESGSLEQDANSVLMLHSDDVDQKYQDHRFLKMFVRKNRDGRLGMVNYTYYGDYVKFVETKWNNDLRIFEEVIQDELVQSVNGMTFSKSELDDIFG